MRQAGLSIGQRFLEVRARVLRGPTLQCREKQMLNANAEKGDWNMTKNQVNKPATIECIFVLNTDNRVSLDQAIAAVRALVGVLRSLGKPPFTRVLILLIIFQELVSEIFFCKKKKEQQGLTVYSDIPRDIEDKTAYYDDKKHDTEKQLDGIIEENKQKNRLPNTPRHVLFIVIVQDNQKATRECVKWWGDVKMGAITQVLVGTHHYTDR